MNDLAPRRNVGNPLRLGSNPTLIPVPCIISYIPGVPNQPPPLFPGSPPWPCLCQTWSPGLDFSGRSRQVPDQPKHPLLEAVPRPAPPRPSQPRAAPPAPPRPRAHGRVGWLLNGTAARRRSCFAPGTPADLQAGLGRVNNGRELLGKCSPHCSSLHRWRGRGRGRGGAGDDR